MIATEDLEVGMRFVFQPHGVVHETVTAHAGLVGEVARITGVVTFPVVIRFDDGEEYFARSEELTPAVVESAPASPVSPTPILSAEQVAGILRYLQNDTSQSMKAATARELCDSHEALRASVASLTGERDEMRSALARVGIVWETEADDEPTWTVCLEPRGEEPALSLSAALDALVKACFNDGLRAARARPSTEGEKT